MMKEEEFQEALKAWLAVEIEQVSVALEDKLLRAMLYGDFGSGKTTLAGQIIKALDCKFMIFNTDSSWVVLQKDPEVAKLIDRRALTGFKQLKVFARAHSEGIEPFCNYGVILIDTLSTGVYNLLRDYVSLKKYTDQRDPDVESWTHYNLVRAKTRELIQQLNQSGLHVIYTAHHTEPSEAEKKDRIIKSYGIRPGIPEKTFNVIAQEVQMMGWLHKDEGQRDRLIQLAGTLRVVAKCQIPGIDEKTYKVTQIPELIKKWVNS